MEVLNEQRLWAYPYGVIVQVKIDKFAIQNHVQKDDHTEELAQLKRLLAAPLRAIESGLEKCAGRKRLENSDLKQSKLIWIFTLNTQFDVTGRTQEIDYSEITTTKIFADCVAQAILELQGVEFPARMMGTTIPLSLRIEVRFLTDEEAMGRGYLYQMAEAQWKKTYNAQEGHWKLCKADSDCVVVKAPCEVDAINRQSVSSYGEAASIRRLPPCEEESAASKLIAKCRKGRCQLKK